jgi:hypothetical protein
VVTTIGGSTVVGLADYGLADIGVEQYQCRGTEAYRAVWYKYLKMMGFWGREVQTPYPPSAQVSGLTLLSKDITMIIRTAKRQGFTVLSNRVIEDIRLSFRARGVLVYILSKPDNWIVRVPELVKAGGYRPNGVPYTGRESILTLLRELEDAGYLTRERRHDEKTGKWVHFQEVHDSPQLK